MTDYRSVSLPEELVKLIEKIIDGKILGYNSVAEYVKAAVRDKISNDSKIYNLKINGGEDTIG